VAGKVSAKKLAGCLNGGSATLADQRQAERVSGSVPGAISPLAPRKRVPVVIDTSAGDHEQIFVSAGRRGLEIALAPHDLVATTKAIMATIISG
jgi:Cys-tRNA(Pro)/Cys-tRNA(Cys) deacylase